LHELTGVGIGRASCNRLSVSDFYNFSFVHDGDAGGEIADDRHGVRDEEVGEAEVALQAGEQIDDLRAHANVEGGDRFVAHDEFGAQSQGAGDADALPLSAGKLVGKAPAGGFVEADGV